MNDYESGGRNEQLQYRQNNSGLIFRDSNSQAGPRRNKSQRAFIKHGKANTIVHQDISIPGFKEYRPMGRKNNKINKRNTVMLPSKFERTEMLNT